MIKPEDITIFYCVHQGYLMTKMAIKSFKICNPEYADRIVIFNDNFDEIEKLRKDVADIITWTISDVPDFVYYHMAAMYQDVSRQCKTRYLCFIDNDTIWHKEGEFKKILEKIEKENAKIFSMSNNAYIKLRGLNNIPLPLRNTVLKYSDVDYKRFHYCFTILDNEYFINEHNIYAYMGKDEYYENDGVDVGTEFYYYCLENNIKFIEVNGTQFVDDCLYHYLPSASDKQFPMAYRDKFKTRDEIKEYEKQTCVGWKKALEFSKKNRLPFERFYDKEI